MSLYLKAIGAPLHSSLLRIHALATTIGLSEAGGICAQEPALPLFTILNNNGNFAILPEHQELRLQGEVLPRAGHRLADSDVINFANYQIQVFVASNITAINPAEPKGSKAWGTLEIKLAGIRHVALLVPGTITVGSSESDTVMLPIPGIEPRHLEVSIQAEGLRLHSASGCTLDQGCALQKDRSINRDAVVRLAPLGIPVHLRKAA